MKNDKTDKKNDQQVEVKGIQGIPLRSDSAKATSDKQGFAGQAEEANGEKVEELLQKVADFENKYKRTLADYQNLEKRALEQRKEWIKTANKDILLRLLPIFDTLLLAKEHSNDKNLEVSAKQFENALAQEGVVRIKTIGVTFDPTLMECTQTQEGEEGKVLSEVRPGYLLYDKALRPALVVVGKGA